jgi:hypothetical protein
MTQDLLQILRSAKHYAWKYIVTLDEAWFYFSNHFDPIWLPQDGLPPSFPKQTIESQKRMITVIWNSHGFHLINPSPKESGGQADTLQIIFFSQISALRDVGSRRKKIVHADNAGPHVAKCVTESMDHNSLKRHLILSSPVLGPSDFY